MEGILPSKYPQANDQNQFIPSKFAFQDLTFLNASFLLCNQTNYHSLSLSRGARKINSFKSYHLTTIHSPKQRLTSSAVEPPQLDSYSLGWMDCIHQVLVISLPPENRLFFFFPTSSWLHLQSFLLPLSPSMFIKKKSTYYSRLRSSSIYSHEGFPSTWPNVDFFNFEFLYYLFFVAITPYLKFNHYYSRQRSRFYTLHLPILSKIVLWIGSSSYFLRYTNESNRKANFIKDNPKH